MDSRTEERVADWDSRPLTDGYESLRELEDESFSGAVEAHGTTLFMLNGKVVGVAGGNLDVFEGATGTIYDAPHPSLPLLFAMREQGGDERAKYYTNDTPISEADDTLSSGSFTGYIELSENVLSGDYYVVYYGGRSMSCAFVGNSEKLITDDEAFDRADNEVGIYTVWDVDIEVTAVPGREDDTETDESTTAAAGAVTDDAAGGAVSDDAAGGAVSDDADAVAVSDDSDAVAVSDDPDDGAVSDAGTAESNAGTGEHGDGTEAGVGAGAATGSGASSTPEAETDPTAQDTDDGVPVRDAEADPGAGAPGTAGGSGTPRGETPGEESTSSGAGSESTSSGAGAGVTDDVVEEAESDTAPRSDAPNQGDVPDRQEASESGGRRASDGDRAETGRRDRAATGQGGESTSGTDRAGGQPPTEGSTPTGTDEAEGHAMAEVPDEVMAEVENEAQSNEFAEEVAWRETTKIPSINPERSTTEEEDDPLATGGAAGGGATSGGGTGGSGAGGGRPGGSGSARDGETAPGRSQQGSGQERAPGGGRSQASSNPSNSQSPGSRQSGTEGSGSRDAGGSGGTHGAEHDGSTDAPTGTVDELRSDLASVQEERDTIASERDRLAAERDELETRNTELAERVEELEAEIEDLEGELADMRDRLENAGGAVSGDAVELSPAEALEGTNLFVRYGSKSATTMEDVHGRDVTVADLEANLRLEYHTGFDAENAVVEGRPFEEFLYDSIEYGFVEWFVYDLVFEIRDTGNEQALGDLYQAFPNVDRIELQGEVSLRYDEDGEEYREQSTFDVVVRDRMGNPLAVAAVNDSREPATEDMMVDLQQRSERVKRTSDALAGAFMVTSSYFDPGSLEIADEATSGSLLSRDSKKSYVKLSRKQGYHLCLVETRNGEFHVNVPEL